MSLTAPYTHRPLTSPPLILTAPDPKKSPSPRCGPPPKPSSPPISAAKMAAAALTAAAVTATSLFRRSLPAEFDDRWRLLRESSAGAEERVKEIPFHLIQAVLASEDRRFFYHFGVDPYGVGRAVVRYPNGGGGSTITQQLVKNVFLTSERKISRKFVEGFLSLALERRMSKWEILYSYLNKMYWGHGNYGIESASLFYFGKHPSLLNLGESALLAGILPSPENLNPLTNPEKGKSSQARALRRMVAAGFVDLETALLVVSHPIHLHNNGSGDTEQEDNDGREKFRLSVKGVWDWKVASITWEAKENMERWAIKMPETVNKVVL